MTTVLSCNNEANSSLNINKDSFSRELRDYCNRQHAVLYSHDTRGTSEMSYEELCDIAKEYDNNLNEFLNKNAELLSYYAPKNHLTNDEVDIMRFAPQQLLDYAKENYSITVYNAIRGFLNKEKIYSVEEVYTNKDLNPLEMAIIVNIDNSLDLQNLVEEWVIDETKQIEYSQSREDLCFDDLIEDLKDCGIDFAIAGFATIEGGPVVAFLSGGVTYAFCARGAYKTYKRCVRDGKKGK